MSPFEIFRRNLKPLMIFLTFLALMSFVVLPVVSDAMRQRSGGGSNAVAARFSGQSISRSRVDYFTQNHYSLVGFLTEIAEETIRRGGSPKTAGFNYDSQRKQIINLGINSQPGTEATIRTFMFAEKAAEEGFELDDSSIQFWLEKFTDGTMSEDEIVSRLMNATRNRMGRPHLYEQLRNHLLAYVYINRGSAGFMSDSGSLLTPDEQWENFLKLNQSATITAYGVLVNDYLEQTDDNPSAAKLREVFEEGKERDPDDQSAEPAFHKPYAAEFEYLVGDYQKFLDAEIAKLSEEEIKAEYERRLKGGDFQVDDLPDSNDLIEAEVEEPAKAEESADAAKEKSKETSDAGDDADAESSEEPAESDQSSSQPMKLDGDTNVVRLVNFLDDEESGDTEAGDEAGDTEAGEKPDADEPSVDSAEVKEEPAKKEADASESPEMKNEEPTDEAKPDQKSEENAGEMKADEKANKDGEEGEKKETEKKESDEPKSEMKDEAENKAAEKKEAEKNDEAEMKEAAEAEETSEPKPSEPEEKPEPKTESFEDVRDEIAADLAGPAARKAMDKAITGATKSMKSYFMKMAVHNSKAATGDAGDPPARPDLVKIGEKYGLTRGVTEMATRNEIAETEIAQSYDVGASFGQRGLDFTNLMYGYLTQRARVAPKPTFNVLRFADDQAGLIYVAWKTAERPAYTPTLDEVRDDVILAVRMQEARELATEDAQKIAEQARGGSELSAIVPEDKQQYIKDSLPPFTWKNMVGFRQVTLGNVPELDSVGEDFMRSTFSTEVGGYAVAANQPERVIYVIKPEKFEPSTDELKDRFLQPINRMMSSMVGGNSREVIQGYYDEVDEAVGYESFIEDDE